MRIYAQEGLHLLVFRVEIRHFYNARTEARQQLVSGVTLIGTYGGFFSWLETESKKFRFLTSSGCRRYFIPQSTLWKENLFMISDKV
jgi:hypothetical protein